VLDAAWMDGENILVLLNEGSYSDGIYSINPGTGEYTLITWLEGPNFIVCDNETDRYFVGYHGGLKYSVDGLTWDSDSNFDNMNIVDMGTFGNHYVVSEMDNLYNIYYSDDAGVNWQTSSMAPMISDLEFHYSGKLYGIFPDESWSSGLWSSNNFGETWNVEFWSVNLSCVGIDGVQDVFIGWQQTLPGSDEGIARWDSVNQNLLFYNQGLPELMINSVTHNPGMSAWVLFACTQNGVYLTYDYVGIKEATETFTSLEAWPNPAWKQLNIRIGTDEYTEVKIHTLNGQLIDYFTVNTSSGELTYDCSSLQQGVYILSIENGHSRQSLKWIKK
jgi:hypothetical protein